MACCGGETDELSQQYRVGAILGKGKFAIVKQCFHKRTGKPYAIKMINKNAVSQTLRHTLKAEVEILKRLNHPNIIKLHRVYDTSTHLNLVIELATGGELFDRIIKRGHYSEKDAAELTSQVASALHYMHSHGVTHRDLKPENLLYADSSPAAQIKITDFGLAKLTVTEADNVMKTAVGTPGYVAPEVLTNDVYGPEVDVWSLGVILYILLCGFPPFHDHDMQSLFRKITKGHFSFPSPHWDNVSQAAKDVVQSMLIVNPAKRATLDEVLANKWVKMENTPRAHLRQTIENLQKMRANERLRKVARGVIAARRFNGGAFKKLRDSLRLSNQETKAKSDKAGSKQLAE